MMIVSGRGSEVSTSRSFDRAAGYYDETRPALEAIATQGTQAILDIAGPTARILEVGAGTGRISIPLLERGIDLVGCDLSLKMLTRLQEKFPAARIVQSDASTLPFPTTSFDAVLTAHVLHLISSWRHVLREFRRVLRPGGVFLNLRTWATVGVSTREQVRTHWRRWLEERGVNAYLPGVQSNEEFHQALQSMGARLTEVEVLRYPLKFTLREELERFASRIYSDSWEIPDAIFESSLKELRTWVQHEYGDLEQQREDEVRFAIDVTRFEN